MQVIICILCELLNIIRFGIFGALLKLVIVGESFSVVEGHGPYKGATLFSG